MVAWTRILCFTAIAAVLCDQTPLHISSEFAALHEKALAALATIPVDDTAIYGDEYKLASMKIPDLSPEQRAYEYTTAKLSLVHEDAFDSLHNLALHGHVPSVRVLAEAYMYGNFSTPPNGKISLQFYEQLRDLAPSSDVYYMLGFIYATGLFGEVEVDQARATMYYNVASDLGCVRSTMALAYRYKTGIAVEKNCGLAMHYYGIVANRSAEYIAKSAIGGPNLDYFALRVADLQGGIFGQGATETITSISRSLVETGYDKDLFNRIQVDIDETEYTAAYHAGMSLYDSTYFTARDYVGAYAKFDQCARDGRAYINRVRTPDQVEKLFIGRCAYMVGHMRLRGEGTTQDYNEAKDWLNFAVATIGSPKAAIDLALIHEYGLGDTPKNAKTAELFYTNALKAKEYSAGVHLAKFFLRRDDTKNGADLLHRAALASNSEAWYHLGKLYERGIKVQNNCEDTTYIFKVFSESIEPVVARLDWAFRELTCGRFFNALLGYAMAAEQGYETAQASVAYLLYQPPSVMTANFGANSSVSAEMVKLAALYYARSSEQGNVDSTIVAGNIYFSGLASEDGAPDYDGAAVRYQIASKKRSSQATWNLGYMYERGLGVPQDFHLAKRYYDLALVMNPSAYVPVKAAVLKLHARSWYNKWIAGGAYLDKAKEETVTKPRTYWDWFRLISRARSGNKYDLDTMEDPETFHPGEEATLTKPVAKSAQLSGEDEDLFDLYLFAFCVTASLIFMLFKFVNQRRVARARNDANGEAPAEAPPQDRFQFNVMVFPI